MDPITIAGTVGAFAHAGNLLKLLAASIKESGKTEANSALLDLQNALFDLQQKQVELFNENVALKEEIREMRQKGEFRAEVSFGYGGVYTRQVGGQTEYYCPNCLDSHGKQVRIQMKTGHHGPFFRCASCDKSFREGI